MYVEFNQFEAIYIENNGVVGDEDSRILAGLSRLKKLLTNKKKFHTMLRT